MTHSSMMNNIPLTDSEFDEYERLMRVEGAYQNFRDFIAMTMPTYEFNWHHEVIIERLNKLMTQEHQRIMIWTAPRHGKSELVSRRFPAFYLGRNPDARVIGCSYNASLAATFNRDVQRILEENVYNDIFPDAMLPNTPWAKRHPDNGKYKRTTSMFELVGRQGFLLSPGVGGTITGLGADLFLIDDPVKNEEEAMSETMRDAIFAWYNSTAYTRLEGGANMVICQTRWHKSDLSGKLIEEMEMGGEKWEIINLPAIATSKRHELDIREQGEALWPSKYDLKRLQVIKKQVGSRVWSSLYMQSPVIEGGNIVKEDWFKFYTTLPFDVNRWREAYLVQSWDLSFKATGKSYVVGVVIGRYKADYYLVDIYRRKADIIETQRAIKKMAEDYPACKCILIEDKANGPAILDLLKKQVSRMIAVPATTSKDERLVAVAPIIESGNFYLPANHPLTKTIIEECCSFPMAENDDIVDAISQGLIRFMEMRGLRHLRAMTKMMIPFTLIPFGSYLLEKVIGG